MLGAWVENASLVRVAGEGSSSPCVSGSEGESCGDHPRCDHYDHWAVCLPCEQVHHFDKCPEPHPGPGLSVTRSAEKIFVKKTRRRHRQTVFSTYLPWAFETDLVTDEQMFAVFPHFHSWGHCQVLIVWRAVWTVSLELTACTTSYYIHWIIYCVLLNMKPLLQTAINACNQCLQWLS